MTDLEAFLSLLKQWNAPYEVEEPDVFDKNEVRVNVEHTGFAHCFMEARFTPNGKFIEFVAGY